jgi:hypothetical protein
MLVQPLHQAPEPTMRALERAQHALRAATAAVDAAIAGLYALSGRTAREGHLTRQEIAKVRQDAILAHLGAHGPTAATELGRALGLPRHLVLHRLRMLRETKRVRLVGQTLAARWALVAPARPRLGAQGSGGTAQDAGLELRWSGAAERAGTVPALTKALGLSSSLRGSHRVAL